MVDGPGNDPKQVKKNNKSPRGSKKWLWIGAVAVACVAIAVAGVLTFQHDGADASATGDASATSQQQPIFFALDPAFVVNFKNDDMVRFLQVKVEIMTHDPSVVDSVKQYAPIIRNNLLLLYSDQTYASLQSRSAKEKLLDRTRREIQKVLKNKTGRGGVEAVYFTSFVMQ